MIKLKEVKVFQELGNGEYLVEVSVQDGNKCFVYTVDEITKKNVADNLKTILTKFFNFNVKIFEEHLNENTNRF